MTVKQIFREGYEPKRKKGRSTSGEFLGFGRPSRKARLRKIMGQRVKESELTRKARLQSARATLEEQKARTRIAKRAGRGGVSRRRGRFIGKPSFAGRSGMRLY